jgi:class 3 adenylate cyclase
VGDLTQPATATDTIAAVFDLEGFTNFCKQIEPQLAVPLFLSEFLTWLMDGVKQTRLREVKPKGYWLYSPLPFFVKFMGDGILFLWDSSVMNDAIRRNVVLSLNRVCVRYVNKFLPQVRKKVVEPPGYLRCGIARGTVFSVGNGDDFVGSCINMAARIQKLPGTRFAFNRRGFDLESPSRAKFFKDDIVVKLVSIRGSLRFAIKWRVRT